MFSTLVPPEVLAAPALLNVIVPLVALVKMPVPLMLLRRIALLLS